MGQPTAGLDRGDERDASREVTLGIVGLEVIVGDRRVRGRRPQAALVGIRLVGIGDSRATLLIRRDRDRSTEGLARGLEITGDLSEIYRATAQRARRLLVVLGGGDAGSGESGSGGERDSRSSGQNSISNEHECSLQRGKVTGSRTAVTLTGVLGNT